MWSPRNTGCIILPLFLRHRTVETLVFYYRSNEYLEVFCDLQHTTLCEVASELYIYSLVVHDCKGRDSMIQVIVSNPMFSSIQKHKIAGRWRMAFIWPKAVMHTVGECLHFSWSAHDLFMMNQYKQALLRCSSTHLKNMGKILRVTP